MPESTQLLLTAFIFVVVSYLAKILFEWYTSPIRNLPGPRNRNWLLGNLADMRQGMRQGNSNVHAEWAAKYGRTFRISGFVSVPFLYTTDLEAVHHVIRNDFDYQKPSATRYRLSRLLGNGVLVMEGEQHKFQRRVMNAAFGPTQIRLLTDTFYEKALLLRDVWTARINDSSPTASATVEASSSLSRATLDIIGSAGFGYSFNSLNSNGEKSELHSAFAAINESGILAPWRILQAQFPALRLLPSFNSRAFRQAKESMARIGSELLAEAKALHAGENSDSAKDLLSLLVKSNMNSSLPPSQRMSDKDVLAQVPTFLVAGHDTTSTATTWALYALCMHQDIQNKLRQELLNVASEQPSMEELNALPYLDNFVHEVLRLYSPVTNTVRIAMKDDVIPLKDGYTDSKGKFHQNIFVRKGQVIDIPISAVNQDNKLWGQDANEFKPERFDKIPEAVSAIPGVWGNMLTFLGGNRACIGWRFSLVEMKVLLFVLICGFEFNLAVKAEDVISLKTGPVMKPAIKVDGKERLQLPLIITPVKNN